MRGIAWLTPTKSFHRSFRAGYVFSVVNAETARAGKRLRVDLHEPRPRP